MKKASIRDVAAFAGVSPGTVSHVLNGNTSARIAPLTQERVRQAARTLGYRPNRVARSLGRQRTDTLGVLLGGLRNPFFTEVFEELQAAAHGAGFDIRLEATPSVHGTFGGYEPHPADWPVDGIVMWANDGTSLETVFGPDMSQVPTLYLGDVRSDGRPFVASDHEAGGQLAAQRLLGRGFRHIGIASPYAFGEDRELEARQRGFRERLAGAGLTPKLYLTDADETREAGRLVGERLAMLGPDDRPEALFCHNDILAIGVCCGLRRAGLCPGRDIAVLGFDGIEEGLYLEEPLTTVVLPVREMCCEAVERLVAHLRGNEPLSSHTLTPTLREGATG